MKFFSRFSRLGAHTQGLIWGVACALLILGVANLNLLGGLERAGLDALFKARGVRFPSPQIAVIVVDDDTVARYGSWPLPRRHYTQLIERLTRDGARTIAFDILFSTPSSNPQDDARFARVCAASRRVIHAAAFHVPLLNGSGDMRRPDLAVAPRARFRIGALEGNARDAAGGFGPQSALQDGAVALGHVNVYPELDYGALRRIPHLIRFRDNQLFPSLALAAVAHALGFKPKQIGFRNGAIQLGDRAIPLNAQGEVLTNWIGGYGSFNHYSLNSVLSERPGEVLPKGTFKDRVVLIGSTATGAYEQRATPFSPLQPAVEMQANAIDDILTRRLLLEIASVWQIVLLLALCAGVGWLSAGRNARFTLLATAGLLVLLWIGALAAFRSNWYWPIGATFLGMTLTAACCVAYQQLYDAYRLKIAEERYALAVRGANDGIWDWNLETDTVYYSPRWKAILGASNGEISHSPQEWLNRVHVADIEMVRRQLEEHLAGKSAHFQCEFRLKHRDENYRWVLARGLLVRADNGTPARMAGSLTDITDRRHAEEKLLQQALSDELTGLPNRTLFMDRLQRAIARSRRRENYTFAVLFLDLDRFKVVNDSLGHLVGDEMLQVVARRLESCLRPGDTVARMGGDEFTMLIDEISDTHTAIHVAERVQSALAQPLQLGGHDYASQASIGIAIAKSITIKADDTRESGDGKITWRPRYDQAEDALRDADTAMYRAKALGRARHVVFDEEMHTHALAQLRLETELRRAIERENFQVFYQPIVELEHSHLSGFEALVRWDDAERGLVPPSEFIAFAEETGLIIALDQWVLLQACRQTKLWQERFDRPDLTISVNLSGRQFSQSGLVKTISGIVAETQLAPECLRLEITEGVVMQNAEASAQILGELKELGFHLSVDDFGTGYSSLSYLHQFPLDVLKVDRSFITRLGQNGENSEIVETIVSLARSLDMKVVAEGVETEVHLQQLQRIGCDCAQGYLFARPLSTEDATIMLRDGTWLPDAMLTV